MLLFLNCTSRFFLFSSFIPCTLIDEGFTWLQLFNYFCLKMSFTFKLRCTMTPHNFHMIWSESTIDVIRRKIWSVVFSAVLAIKKCLWWCLCLWSILQFQTMSENRIVFDLTSHTGLLLLLLAGFFRFYRPYVGGQFCGQAHGWIDNQIILPTVIRGEHFARERALL